MPIDTTAMLQTLLLSALGWLIGIARQTLKGVKDINERVVVIDAWRIEHDRSDERRFGNLERDVRHLKWNTARDDDSADG